MPFNKPILGTIEASVLSYVQLINVTGDPDVVDPKKSQWVPADGRNIAGSQLAKITGVNKAPDLRGRFLRGLNVIFADNQQPRLDQSKADEGDPHNTRKVIDYQPDAYASHSHDANGHINGSVCGSNNTHDVDGGGDKWNCDPGLGDHNVVVTIQQSGDKETRPKNIAVYYYIKIN